MLDVYTLHDNLSNVIFDKNLLNSNKRQQLL